MTKENIKKIKDYYNINVDIENNILINNKLVALTSNKVTFSFGSKNINNHITISILDLYKNFTNLNEEQLHIKQYGCTKKTNKYLNKCLSNIGFISTNSDHIGIKFNKLYSIEIWDNLTGSGKVDCGKLTNDNWIAQYSYRTNIDDYIIINYTYNQKPTKEMIINTRKILNFIYDLSSKSFCDVFICWECSKKINFVDIPGNLNTKINNCKSHYCGC